MRLLCLSLSHCYCHGHLLTSLPVVSLRRSVPPSSRSPSSLPVSVSLFLSFFLSFFLSLRARKEDRPTSAECIDPSKCEDACSDAMPEQLEQIMFEERIARTTMGKTTAQEMCIRGCTDRKVSLHG